MAAPSTREAPTPNAVPANQLVVAGNACGPAALLNAFRFGNPSWQRASNAIAGNSDKERITGLIRNLGMRPSNHLKGRARWSRRGVNLADLGDMGNEVAAGHFLPPVSIETFFLGKDESPGKLLARVHRRLDTSLAKGLPPILSLRRFVHRKQAGKAPEWIVVEAHFVTVVSIPRKVGKNDLSFRVGYIDPWGGKRCEGLVQIPDRPFLNDPLTGQPSPCLEAAFPEILAGKKLVRKGEPTVVAVSGAIGRW